MEGRLVPELDPSLKKTGKKVCVSCNQWNCWHRTDRACDIDGCQCTCGNDAEEPYERTVQGA